jgi:3-demethoxyubiquinol 3-hydroxylase
MSLLRSLSDHGNYRMRGPLTPLDAWLSAGEHALRTLAGASVAARPSPAANLPKRALDETERRLSGALMRVDHVGEVCAQALYRAQSLVTSDAALRERFIEAAREETDHLAWTKQRLDELGARPSLLNPLWYAGAFGIGLLAGRFSDRTSLGFVVETERQVEQHLDGHLQRLPMNDGASRAIVERMKDDEARHAMQATQAGAAELSAPVRLAMRLAARVMTRVAHRV